MNSMVKYISGKIIGQSKIIGITGPDTAGKTTFANQLESKIKNLGYSVCVIHLDYFHNPPKIRNKIKGDWDYYIQNAFNIETIKEKLLLPVLEGQTFKKTLLHYDWRDESFSNPREYEVNSNTKIILEGLFLHIPKIRTHLDPLIYIHVDLDQLIPRALKRAKSTPKDIESHYLEKRIPVQEAYILKFDPLQNSDIIINNNF